MGCPPVPMQVAGWPFYLSRSNKMAWRINMRYPNRIVVWFAHSISSISSGRSVVSCISYASAPLSVGTQRGPPFAGLIDHLTVFWVVFFFFFQNCSYPSTKAATSCFIFSHLQFAIAQSPTCARLSWRTRQKYGFAIARLLTSFSSRLLVFLWSGNSFLQSIGFFLFRLFFFIFFLLSTSRGSFSGAQFVLPIFSALRGSPARISDTLVTRVRYRPIF